MTRRERILAALDRRPSDRLPVDLGGTLATTTTARAHERLRAHLGLPAEPPAPVFATRSSTVIPDAAILDRFDVDARPLLLGSPDSRPDRWLSADAFVDEWGVTWTRPEGGHFICTDGPFYGMEEPTVRDLETFQWPDPADRGRYRGLRERARALRETGDHAIVLNLPVGPIHQCQFMRGYGEWLEDLLLNPGFAEGLMDRVVDCWVQIVDEALAGVGEDVDLVVYGDDVGTQRGPLVAPDLYRRVIKPWHRRMSEAVRRHGKPIVYHSCGSIYALVPDLVEIGIDALNPVQVTAADMDTARLKREFGRDLAFWGGIDTQRVLPLGTPADVREEVRRRVADLAEGGGYVLCAVHNIQPEVPPENVVAMYDAARGCRR